MRQFCLQGRSYLFHGLSLGSGSYTGHGQTDVDGGPDTLVEELSLQEDLTVGDGDHVGGNVRGHVTGLGLDDGQSGEGATTHFVGPARFDVCYNLGYGQQK